MKVFEKKNSLFWFWEMIISKIYWICKHMFFKKHSEVTGEFIHSFIVQKMHSGAI